MYMISTRKLLWYTNFQILNIFVPLAFRCNSDMSRLLRTTINFMIDGKFMHQVFPQYKNKSIENFNNKYVYST